MKNIIVILSMFLAIVNGQKQSKVQAYINQWDDIAVREMKQYGIPASITLAQGILESGYGQSKLARKANNHFGIKCGSDWKGASIKKDDDRKNECFRKYKKAEDSYRDHSLFLYERARYDFLFEYKITDYKKWARGLKKAGYATDPSYPKRLINLIEKYELYKYDQEGGSNVPSETPTTNGEEKTADIKETVNDKGIFDYELKELEVEIHKGRRVYQTPNGVYFIVIREGDTYSKLADFFEKDLWQLKQYNNVDQEWPPIKVGEILYITPLKMNSWVEGIQLLQETTVKKISLRYAINEKRLRKLNGFGKNQIKVTPQVIILSK